MSAGPEGLSRAQYKAAVDHAIRERRTRKVLAGVGDDEAAFIARVRECVALAGQTPFHFARTDAVPEPWRMVFVDASGLQALGEHMGDQLLGKLPKIFAAAGCMVHVTWVPEADAELAARRDWEHAAATAAAVQTLLLAAQARGLGSYWCSARPLNGPRCLEFLGVPEDERYVGSVFLGTPLSPAREQSDGWSGKLRDKRSSPRAWCRFVTRKDR